LNIFHFNFSELTKNEKVNIKCSLFKELQRYNFTKEQFRCMNKNVKVYVRFFFLSLEL